MYLSAFYVVLVLKMYLCKSMQFPIIFILLMYVHQ